MHSPVSKIYRSTAIKPLLLVTMLASCFATSAIAQEAVDTEEKTLQPVVVTASRVEQLQKDAIPDTTVITSKMIENKKLADIPSLLRSEAGIEFARSGGAGSATSVYMRGTNSTQFLVLLDGVPIKDGNAVGTIDLLAHIQPDQIERIEVVRGNVSAIYGSGAMGGVIQIFTKEGTGTPSGNVFAEYGSHNTVKFGAGVSGKHDDTRYALSVTRYKTNGFSAMNPAHSNKVNPDDDHDRNVSFNASLSQRLNKDHELGARLYMYDAKFDYDTNSGVNDDATNQSKQWTAAIYSKNRFTQNWLSTLTLSYNKVDRTDDVLNTDLYFGSNSDRHSKYRSETSLMQWENRLALSSDWTLTAGVDLGREKAYTDSKWFDNPYNNSHFNVDRDKYSAYAGLLGKIGAHHLQANMRYDHVDNAGADTTGYLGYGYDLTSAWKLLASVSTSFLAPTLYQQYDPSMGNKDLKSERSTNYEAGIQYAQGKDLVRLTVFKWRTRNLIEGVYDPVTFEGDFYNVDNAKNTGVELNLATNVLSLDVRANLTWQNPKNRETDESLSRRARMFGSLNVSKTFGQWYLGGDIQYNGHRDDSTYNDYRLPSYAIVNLDARYNLNKNVSFYARIENLLDRDYQTAWSYNQPGRGAYVGVNFKM